MTFTAFRASAISLLCMVAGWTSPAVAHDRSQSFSTWEWSGAHLTGTFTIDARRATLLYADDATDASRALPLDARLAQHLANTVRATQDETSCETTPPVAQPAAAGWQRVSLAFNCPHSIDAQPVELQIDALFRYAATHLHFVNVAGAGQTVERVLTAQRPSIQLGTETTESGFVGFVVIGAEHVASGWDHVAFLAALLLLIPGWKPRLWTITGFTLGHSITLGLSVTGRIEPHSVTVEALIGFSVAYAAFEAARRRGLLSREAQAAIMVAIAGLAFALLWLGLSALSPWTWFACLLLLCRLLGDAFRSSSVTGPALAAAFGLIHGAGFAGALLDIHWRADQLLPVLAGFNIGVEIGQIGIVLLLATLGHVSMVVWRRVTEDSGARWPQTLATGLLCLAGMNWFLSRAIA